MTIEEVLAACRERKIELWSDQDGIGYRCPPGEMTNAMLRVLSLRKDEISAVVPHKETPALPTLADIPPGTFWHAEDYDPSIFDDAMPWREYLGVKE